MLEQGSDSRDYRALSSCFSHCSELVMKGCPLEIDTTLRWFDGSKAPRLRAVTVYTYRIRTEEKGTAEDSLVNIPALRSLCIWGACGIRPPFTTTLFAQLSELTLHYPCGDGKWRISDWRNLLSSCSRLEVLALHNPTNTRQQIETHPTPQLPLLRSFVIKGVQTGQLLTLLLNIDAPQLHSLELDFRVSKASLKSLAAAAALTRRFDIFSLQRTLARKNSTSAATVMSSK
ncbi:hypothetical protein BOTBODRAFT_370404 [Botryobasidium botryosum FD-172 SS1]|uniref:F-box domain-containing protein n=1 Tax=Botryobasidium botryosum (strain FD-172 SS1) TaxID=930990 RepID=A0A067MCP8_BOTB1|nr:hypothetical protein BOTBODRAFT_370404 [Botryobasidium botryosum FD-172 SS1]